MRGRSSKILLFLFLLSCFFPFSSYSQPQEGLSDGWYAVSEEELTRLEEIMTTQENLLKRQEKQLRTLLDQLKEADQATNNLSLSIARLQTSLIASERESAIRRVANWVLAGTTTALTILYLLK